MLTDSARGHGPKLPAALTLAVVWLVGTAILFVFSGSLMRVQYRDGHLYASNFRREIEIRGDPGQWFGAGEISRIHMQRKGQKVDV